MNIILQINGFRHVGIGGLQLTTTCPFRTVMAASFLSCKREQRSLLTLKIFISIIFGIIRFLYHSFLGIRSDTHYDALFNCSCWGPMEHPGGIVSEKCKWFVSILFAMKWCQWQWWWLQFWNSIVFNSNDSTNISQLNSWLIFRSVKRTWKNIFKSDELTSWLFARNQCRPGHSQFFPSSRLSTENVITFRNHTLTLSS